jgi:SAM-dependent methyltransferase
LTKHFVEFWEKIMDVDDAKSRADYVFKYISKYNKSAVSVLELGCGIGNVLQFFPKKYKLYGLDREKRYVERCRERVRGTFFVSSMHNFKINEKNKIKKFDVIYSVHDSINFLKNFEQWKSTFFLAKNHLSPGGVLIFDMYTPKMIEDSKKSKASFSEFKNGYMSDKAIIKGNTLTWDFKIFEGTGKNNYEMHRYLMTETIFPVNKVREELKKNFKILEEKQMYDGKKIIFVCRLSD